MRRRVTGPFALVVRAGHDLPGRTVHDHRPDRYVVVLERGARLGERRLHPEVGTRAGH